MLGVCTVFVVVCGVMVVLFGGGGCVGQVVDGGRLRIGRGRGGSGGGGGVACGGGEGGGGGGG